MNDKKKDYHADNNAGNKLDGSVLKQQHEIQLPVIRSIACRYGYTEIQFNEESRVVAFKSMDSKVRINIYYTTGTVASCLFHPSKGKSQLFRRNQSIKNIETIFANPRTHTGDGYYNVKEYCDDELRWRYVAAVTTGFCNQQQASQIAATCKLWNEIRFDKNGPTGRDVYNSLSEEEKSKYPPLCQCKNDCGRDRERERARAGTCCVLGTILINIARDTEGPNLQIKKMVRSDFFESTIDNDIPKHMSCDQFSTCKCMEGFKVANSLSKSLLRFSRQLTSVPKPIRRELIYFFLQKLMHQYDLLVNSKDDLGAAQLNSATIYTKEGGFNIAFYSEMFLDNDVLMAHHEYGKLTYADEAVGGRCNCHGTYV